MGISQSEMVGKVTSAVPVIEVSSFANPEKSMAYVQPYVPRSNASGVTLWVSHVKDEPLNPQEIGPLAP